MSGEAEEAYALAEERIAQAKAEYWKYLNLSGDTTELSYKNERRWGLTRFKSLNLIPPRISDLQYLERLDIDNTDITEISEIAKLQNLEEIFLFNTNLHSLIPLKNLKTEETQHI